MGYIEQRGRIVRIPGLGEGRGLFSSVLIFSLDRTCFLQLHRCKITACSLKSINKSNICTNNSFIYINISFILINISLIYIFLRGVDKF